AGWYDCGAGCEGGGGGWEGCVAGRWRCGDGSPCESAAAPTCCGGGCVDPQSDIEHCGACGQSCLDRDGDGVNDAPEGNDVACVGGACKYECQTGFKRCDANSEACLDVMNDVNNCGDCGNTCPGGDYVQNPVCNEGSCGAVCLLGYDSCTGNAGELCETNIRTSVDHCGSCNQACEPKPNATVSCRAGDCEFTCLSGFADVDGNPNNGCEVNLMTNVNHCGTVNNKCPSRANATLTCVEGACGFTCLDGFGDCNGNPTDGCELNLN